MRLVVLYAALALSLLLAVLTLRTPSALPQDAAATAFSAQRAFSDIEAIAREPHPVGSAEHARVQAVLLDRMRALGLTTSVQAGPLSRGGARHLRRMGGDPAAADHAVLNLVGVLPGRKPELPAVALMAHYDTVVGSAGAADNSTGVAAALETLRAVRARGVADRTLVVLFTDAEEVGLDGARVFWGDHPLRDRIGAVVNLEARGGGGRAMMFETGRGNAETIELLSELTPRVDGGVTSNSLAVFVYGLMRNDTDFTVPRNRGVQGINLAFIGRPEQYHASSSTPDALDRGSVQHIGSQALEVVDAMLRAPALPARSEDVVYADLFGKVVLAHPSHAGWILLLGAGVLTGFAVARVRRQAGLSLADLGRGMLDGIWFLTAGFILAQAIRLLAGPTADADLYYVLLARLPWVEAGVAGGLLALVLVLLAGRVRLNRRWTAALLAALTLTGLAFGGFDPILAAAGVLSVGLSWLPRSSARSDWGGWTGLIVLMLMFGTAAQLVAPATAFLFLWPALAAGAMAAAAGLIDPALVRPLTRLGLAVGAAVGVGWILTLAHPVFLGVGMDLPGALALLGFLSAMFLRPLAPPSAAARPLLAAAAVVLLLGAGASASSRWLEPIPAADSPSASS